MKNLVYFLISAGLIMACGDDDAPPPPPPQDFSLSINSGGPAFAFDGTNWVDDTGNTYNTATDVFENVVAIEGTENDGLYQTEVFDVAGFTYEVAVPGEGPWEVDLHFAEIFHGVDNANGVGARIFDVNIENGQATLDNYDIIEQAGAAATAKVENFQGITVQDGTLTITFTSIVDAAKVSGVEVKGTF